MLGGGLEAVTVAVDKLFVGSASVVEELTVAVSLILVPSATEQSTVATIVKVAGDSLGAIVVFVQDTVPLEPIAGVVQVLPAPMSKKLRNLVTGKIWELHSDLSSKDLSVLGG